MAKQLVLIVEEHPAIGQVIGEVLEEEISDVETTIASDGLAGVRAARSLRPDLVLLDLDRPGIDGCEVARWLKSDPSTTGIPVVALTAPRHPGDRKRALAAGCDDYVRPSLSDRARFDRFLQTIRGYLHRDCSPRALVESG
jgi:two-component system cell cycle response regulator DivK